LVLRPLAASFSCVVALAIAFGCGGGDSTSPQVLVGGPASPTASPRALAASATPVPVTPTPAPTPTRTPAIVSLSWLAGDQNVQPLPVPFAAPVADAGLQAAVQSALAGREGSYSVVVQNLASGRYAALNEGKVYYGASLYKLELLLEAYRQRDAGELDFARLLTLERKYVEQNLGTLESLGLAENDQVSVADAIRAMIVVSDTPTAVLMHDVLGPLRVDATLQSLGITDTESANRELPATARDMARLLAAVAAGEGVSDASRLEMLSLLSREWFRGGVPAGLPEGTALADKTGSYANATHDVALVWGPAGPYIIAVLTDRSYDWEPIREVSRAVWEYFAANP